MKFIGYAHEYDISNLPIDSKDIYNDLVLSLSGLPVHTSQLQNILYFAPNINSIRRIKRRKNGDILKQKKGGVTEIAFAAPDVNLYLALQSILLSKANPDKELKVPKTFSEALTLFENTEKDSVNQVAYAYYKALFQHELAEYEDNFSKWEINRIY